MKYYIANLCVHFVVVTFLLVMVIIFTNKNLRKKTKFTTLYFFPLLFSAILLFSLIKYTGPRLLDLSDVISENYYSYTGKLDEIGKYNNYLVVDGVTYYINPLRQLPEVGSEIRIRYTKYSKYVIDVADATLVNVEESINEELQNSNNGLIAEESAVNPGN